jgi:integrase
MGSVFKKTYTKPLPEGAELFARKGERFARWKDKKGRTRTAPLTTGKDGSERVVLKAATYTAKYRDGSGVVREKALGCREKESARQMLARLEQRAEKVRTGVVTATEEAISDHQDAPLGLHFSAYIDHQNAKEVSRQRVKDTRSQLRRVARDCGFRALADLDGLAFERWLAARKSEGMAAATRNEYRGAFLGFANWCIRNRRLATNPFGDVPRADVKSDRRRVRRALAEAELEKLLEATRRRPVVDAMTVRRGKNKGKAIGKLRESTRQRLEKLGRERALLYKTYVLSGLRKSELASLTVAQLEFDGPIAYAVLEAADEKNRSGSEIPLREDLADDLRQWLKEKLATIQQEARHKEQPVPLRLPPNTPVFYVPKGLIRILDRDLKLAGIPKVDERGRTVDVHSLRHTFGTHLSKGGVAPRTAQAAMRHSSIDLTMNVYTDPKLLDVHGALDALPSLPLESGSTTDEVDVSATGADDLPLRSLAPMLAPTTDDSGQTESIPGNTTVGKPTVACEGEDDATSYPVKTKEPLSRPDNDSSKWAMTDLNRRHPRCKRGALAN